MKLLHSRCVSVSGMIFYKCILLHLVLLLICHSIFFVIKLHRDLVDFCDTCLKALFGKPSVSIETQQSHCLLVCTLVRYQGSWGKHASFCFHSISSAAGQSVHAWAVLESKTEQDSVGAKNHLVKSVKLTQSQTVRSDAPRGTLRDLNRAVINGTFVGSTETQPAWSRGL